MASPSMNWLHLGADVRVICTNACTHRSEECEVEVDGAIDESEFNEYVLEVLDAVV